VRGLKDRLGKRQVLAFVPCAALLALFATLGRRIVFSGSVGGSAEQTFMEPIRPVDLLVFAGFAAVIGLGLTGLFLILRGVAARRGLLASTPMPRRWAWVFAGILFAAWLPYLLALYPGCVLPDSLTSVAQALGLGSLGNHHPVSFTAFVWIFFRVGSALGLGPNGAVFLYSLAQSALMAGAFGYGAWWLTAKAGFSRGVGFVALGYFALTPVFPIYALNMQKDPLFSTACFLMVLAVMDALRSRGESLRGRRQVAYVCGLALVVTLFRNGGILVVVCVLAALMVALRAQADRPALRRACLTVGGVAGVSQLAVLGLIATGLVAGGGGVESFSIPVQQMSRVAATGGSMSADDRALMDRMLPVDEYPASYSPALVDSIKWNPDFRFDALTDNPARTLAVYVDMGVRNPGAYAQAYLLETFGFWKPGVKNSYGFIDTRVEPNGYGIAQSSKLPGSLGRAVQSAARHATFFGSGTLAWVLLASLALLVAFGASRYCAALVPCLAPWVFGMAATPVAFSLRYVFVLAIALPFLAAIPMMAARDASSRTCSRRENPSQVPLGVQAVGH
jgi:hypothetical protein